MLSSKVEEGSRLFSAISCMSVILLLVKSAFRLTHIQLVSLIVPANARRVLNVTRKVRHVGGHGGPTSSYAGNGG